MGSRKYEVVSSAVEYSLKRLDDEQHLRAVVHHLDERQIVALWKKEVESGNYGRAVNLLHAAVDAGKYGKRQAQLFTFSQVGSLLEAHNFTEFKGLLRAVVSKGLLFDEGASLAKFSKKLVSVGNNPLAREVFGLGLERNSFFGKRGPDSRLVLGVIGHAIENKEFFLGAEWLSQVVEKKLVLREHAKPVFGKLVESTRAHNTGAFLLVLRKAVEAKALKKPGRLFQEAFELVRRNPRDASDLLELGLMYDLLEKNHAENLLDQMEVLPHWASNSRDHQVQSLRGRLYAVAGEHDNAQMIADWLGQQGEAHEGKSALVIHEIERRRR